MFDTLKSRIYQGQQFIKDIEKYNIANKFYWFFTWFFPFLKFFVYYHLS